MKKFVRRSTFFALLGLLFVSGCSISAQKTLQKQDQPQNDAAAQSYALQNGTNTDLSLSSAANVATLSGCIQELNMESPASGPMVEKHLFKSYKQSQKQVRERGRSS